VDLTAATAGTPLVVARIVDQDPSFLRFAESHGLVPGAEVHVDVDSSASDAVRVRFTDGRVVTLGGRAAAKILVTD
jgi:Fe2+ transport system protein FeoA